MNCMGIICWKHKWCCTGSYKIFLCLFWTHHYSWKYIRKKWWICSLLCCTSYLFVIKNCTYINTGFIFIIFFNQSFHTTVCTHNIIKSWWWNKFIVCAPYCSAFSIIQKQICTNNILYCYTCFHCNYFLKLIFWSNLTK